MKKNIIANFIGRFWSIMSTFLFIPLYIHYLGFESYALISFTLIIAGIMTVLDGGLTATLSREFARRDILQSDKLRSFRSLEAAYSLLVIFCIGLVFLSSQFVSEHWIRVQAFSPATISLLLKVLSFEIGFQLLLRFYLGGLLGLEKQLEANLYQVGWGVIRNGAVVLVILFLPNLKLFFIWQAAVTVLFTILIKYALERHINPHQRVGFGLKIEKQVTINVGKFAGGMFLISLVAALNTQLDKLAISKLLSLENLGYYTLAVSLAQGLTFLVNPIATALLPRFTAYYSTNEQAAARKLFLHVHSLIAILVFSVLAVLSFFAREVVWIWTGNAVIADHVYMLVPVVSVAYSMLSLQFIPFNIAIANGYTRLNNILGLVSIGITIPGYFFATKTYGPIGAGYVFCFVQVITTWIYLYFINRKFLKCDFVKDIFFKQLLLPLLVAGIVAYLLSHISLQSYSRINSFLCIVIITFATIAITSVILLPFHLIRGWMNALKLIFHR